jgi:hypothetical protein
MPGSNIWKRALPSPFARYIARSALRSRSSLPGCALDAMPMLAPTKISWPWIANGSRSESSTRCATICAPFVVSRSSSRIANSSPPKRAAVSDGRSQRRSRPATSTSSSSPAACPRLS